MLRPTERRWRTQSAVVLVMLNIFTRTPSIVCVSTPSPSRAFGMRTMRGDREEGSGDQLLTPLAIQTLRGSWSVRPWNDTAEVRQMIP